MEKERISTIRKTRLTLSQIHTEFIESRNASMDYSSPLYHCSRGRASCERLKPRRGFADHIFKQVTRPHARGLEANEPLKSNDKAQFLGERGLEFLIESLLRIFSKAFLKIVRRLFLLGFFVGHFSQQFFNPCEGTDEA